MELPAFFATHPSLTHPSLTHRVKIKSTTRWPAGLVRLTVSGFKISDLFWFSFHALCHHG